MNKAILIVAIAATLTGCGSFQTPRATLNRMDLQHYRIDCSRKEEQKAFIQRHMPSLQEKYSNAFSMTSMLGIGNAAVQGTLEDDYAMFNGEQEAAARIILYQLDAYCRDPEPAKKPKPQGCVALDESMPSGASSGAKCEFKGKGKLKDATTRWEALVDN